LAYKLIELHKDIGKLVNSFNDSNFTCKEQTDSIEDSKYCHFDLSWWFAAIIVVDLKMSESNLPADKDHYRKDSISAPLWPRSLFEF